MTKAAAGLAVLVMVAVMAAPAAGRARANHTPLSALFGTVVEISLPDTLTVATDSRVVQLFILDDSVFTGDITSIEDISEGDRIIASVHEEEDGVLTAEKVLVRPDLSNPVTKHIFGVVLEFTNGVVIVQDNDGNSITIEVPTGMSVPETGTLVTVVAQLDRATGKLTARAFELAENVVERLREAADNAEDEEQKEELEERLQAARNKLLSALERARVALQRARDAVADASPEERDEAERRLARVQEEFDELLTLYQQAASERDERPPALLLSGTILYERDLWLQTAGTFTLASGEGLSRTFAWNENTLAVVPLESPAGSPTPVGDAEVVRSEPVPLRDVKDRIASGSQVIVQYDPAAEPSPALVITLLPPKLPAEIAAALEKERDRNISGFITLVQATPDLKGLTGIVVLTNQSTGAKVVAKVTQFTAIEVDGARAMLTDLAAGMAAEIEFDTVNVTEDTAAVFTVDGRLDATRIRARSTVSEDEVNIAGVIVGIDSDSRTVSIKPGEGKVVQGKIVDEAAIVKNGQQVPFSQLAVGDLVMDATRYNRDTLVLTRLAVLSQRVLTFSGTISGIDQNPYRLTVTTAVGDVLTVYVTPETPITSSEGAPLEFGDLAVGDRVLKGAIQPVQLNGRTVNLGKELIVGQPYISTARGVVGEVDADGGTLTVLPGPNSSATASAELILAISGDEQSRLYKNGQLVTSLDAIAPGDIVESVSYYTSNSQIVKLYVVSPNLQRIRGTVLTVDEAGLSVTTENARTVSLSVDGNTQIILNGRSVDVLTGVRPGDIVSEAVYIARTDNPDEGAALELTIFNPVLMGQMTSMEPGQGSGLAPVQPVIQTTVSGVIRSIEGDAWVIGGQKFLVTPATQYFGERPAVGLVAQAALLSQQDGTLVATAVSVAGDPGTNPTSRPIEIRPADPDSTDVTGQFRISGLVQSIEQRPDSITIIVVDGVPVTLNADTTIVGEMAQGNIATAVVSRALSGAVIATSVTFTTAAGATTQPSSGSGTAPDDSGAAQAADGELFETEFIAHRINGRLVLGADDRLYLLTDEQVKDLEPGDTVSVRVKRVQRADLLNVLSAFDIVAVKNNLLFTLTAGAEDNALYVAEPTPAPAEPPVTPTPPAGDGTENGAGGDVAPGGGVAEGEETGTDEPPVTVR